MHKEDRVRLKPSWAQQGACLIWCGRRLVNPFAYAESRQTRSLRSASSNWNAEYVLPHGMPAVEMPIPSSVVCTAVIVAFRISGRPRRCRGRLNGVTESPGCSDG